MDVKVARGQRLTAPDRTPVRIEPLDAAVLRELSRTWNELNHQHFGDGMRPPVLAFATTDGPRLGAWRPNERTIELSLAFVHTARWSAVVEVLKHEMAHQYVDEVLRPTGEPAHGPAFRTVCARLGISSRASGTPTGDPDAGDTRILDRIQRLLALGNSPNHHEAEAAMKAAHRLILKHNVTAPTDVGRRYEFRQVGEQRQRFDTPEKLVAGLLGRHFFVRPIWIPVFIVQTGHSGRALELSGTRANLDIAEHVHAFLLSTAARLWSAHQTRHGIRSNAERRRYLAGVVTGFNEKLEQGAQECAREGLIRVGDPGLDSFVHTRHPHLRKGRTQVTTSDEFHAGREAGHTIVLRNTVSGPATSRGRLLDG